MGTDAPDSNDSPNQSPEERRKIVQSLVKGDDILLNRRERSLTVCDVARKAKDGNLTQVTLAGNGTEYTLLVANKFQQIPTITWPSATHSHPVIRIEPASDTIISTARVPDLYPTLVQPSNRVEIDYEPRNEPTLASGTEQTTIIGSCPQCNSIVVSDKLRAICSTCRAWCWIERWERYYAALDTQSEADDKATNLQTYQQTLDEYE